MIKFVPVLFLDLDGTVRWGYDELGRFVNGPEDVKVFDGVPELLQAYRALGWRICGCSNQGGISLGHVTEQQVIEALKETSRQCGSFAIDGIQYCGHHPGAPDPLRRDCVCRKPKYGMLGICVTKLMDGHPNEEYPPSLSLFVGDRPEDQQCAEAAGVPFMWAKEWRTGGHLANVQQAVGTV